jgi:hypothetical protein|tara:strand:- start:1094 stop:1267 length:174 start_codon:yes stop_codon:yes gene_type:complete
MQNDLMSYWVVKVYDPSIDMFSDAYKSYGKDIANQKLIQYLAKGLCAVIEYRKLPMI